MLDRALILTVAFASASPSSVATLCNPLLCVEVTAGPTSTLVSALRFSHNLSGDTSGLWTPNLLFATGGGISPTLSTTTLVDAAGGVHTARGGVVVVSNATQSATISNISLGSVATETWSLLLSPPAVLSWRVTRTFLVGGGAARDSAPVLSLHTSDTAYGGDARGSDWRSMVLMPSWLSGDALLNASGLAYPLAGGGTLALLHDSGTASAALLLSPAGVLAPLAISASGPGAGDCRLAVLREESWMVHALGFGAECAAVAPYAFAAGDTATRALELSLTPAGNGLAQLALKLPDKGVSAFAAKYAQVYNMFKGWLYGNSPASETCIHEVSLFPQLQLLYSVQPAEFQSLSTRDAVGKHLDFIFAHSVRADGFVAARWSEFEGNQWPGDARWNNTPDMCLSDQMPHLVLAAYYHVLGTGDRGALARWMPALDRVMGYMASAMRMAQTLGALLTNTEPLCDGRGGVSGAGNWLDDIRFGWQDAIVGAYAVEAVKRLGELKEWAGDAAGGAALRTLHAAAVGAYNGAYWNNATGLYRDWVDVEGRDRNYAYLWQQYLAIEFGIADADRAQAALAAIDRAYDAAAAAQNVSRAALWCAPTNLLPVHSQDITVDFDGEYVWPHYENGECFHWQLGIEILSLGRADADAAYARFAGVRPEFERSRMWGQRYSWVQGAPLGSDVITDGLFVVYGGLFGAFGVRPSLRGVEVVARPAAALEGASFRFGLMGTDVTLAVVNGTVVVK